MSEILKQPVQLDKIYAFTFYQTREQYEALTGNPCPPYDPGKRIKQWEDPAADLSEDLVAYVGLAIDKNTPDGEPMLDAGKPYTKVFRLLPEDARRVNIPPDAANFPRLSTPAYPVPLAFDSANYELFLRSPLDQTPWVRDKRAPAPLTDSQKIDAVYRKVVLGE